MKISNINPFDKLRVDAKRCRSIKNRIVLVFNFTLLQVALPLSAFANGDEDHPPGTPHTEAASIDPTMVIGIVIFLVIGAFIVWKFVLRNPNPPPSSSTQLPSNPQVQEKAVSQSGESDSSQKS